jgi:thioredoxin-like negative regulator of GroEL
MNPESPDPFNENAILLYFTSPDCNVCKVLLPKVRELAVSKFPLLKLHVVDIASNRAMAGKFQIYTVPVILVLFEGREFSRKVRNFSIQELEKEIERPYKLFFH